MVVRVLPRVRSPVVVCAAIGLAVDTAPPKFIAAPLVKNMPPLPTIANGVTAAMVMVAELFGEPMVKVPVFAPEPRRKFTSASVMLSPAAPLAILTGWAAVEGCTSTAPAVALPTLALVTRSSAVMVIAPVVLTATELVKAPVPALKVMEPEPVMELV